MSAGKLQAKPPASKRSQFRRAAKIAAWAALVLIGAYAVVLAFLWPFTQRKIAQRLGRDTSSDVRFRDFHASYFPPGCVIRDLEVRPLDEPASPPLITVRRLTVATNYRELWHHRVETLRLEDVRVDALRSWANTAASGAGSKRRSKWISISVAEVIIERAVVEYPRRDKPPLVYQIHRLALDHVVRGTPISFHVDLDNALPPGRIHGDGQFSPWQVARIADTPMSGAYTFSDAHLDVFRGIGGTLSSQGTFMGPANALQVRGTTHTPDYQVKSAGHPIDLRADFQAIVNCANGDLTLQNVQAQYRRAMARFRGDIKRSKSTRARVASLQVDASGARIEDLFWLLSGEKDPAMTGSASFHARLIIPGGMRPFIQRVRLQGQFDIDGGRFTKPETQRRIISLSYRAEGRKVSKDAAANLPDPPASLGGHVDLLNGVAHFSKVSFAVPGAVADIHGNYNLNDERVDFRGQLIVDKKFSRTANTLPSRVFTWAGEKLFAKGVGEGEILPIKLTGTYDHPSFGLQK